MANAAATAFDHSFEFAMTKALMPLLEEIPQVSREQATRIANGLETNSQVSHAWNIPDRVSALLIRHGFQKVLQGRKV